MIELKNLKEILEATGFPVAYSHFTQSDNEPLPVPPFIVYLVAFSDNFMADNKVYKQIQNVNIELYTNRKDINAEKKVEEVLEANEIPFNTTEFFVDEEQLFQKIYEVRLL